MNRVLLFVDDDADVREALADLLAFIGWTVVHVGDGEEALAWLESGEQPAIILLDLNMPRCDGYAFRQRQLADARFRDIPTAVFTADANPDGANLSSLGGAPVVLKSIPFPDLNAILVAEARSCKPSQD